MHSSSYRRALVFALLALLTGLFLFRADTHASFTGGTTAMLSAVAPGAAADTTITTSAPAPDLYFSTLAYGTPGASFIAPGPGHPAFAAGVHPPKGNIVGTLGLATDLGFFNGLCGAAPPTGFTLLNATVDIADLIDPVPQASTNPGSGGTLDNMWSDNGSSTTGPGADPPWDAAWPGMDAGEAANGLPAHLDEYPSFLNLLFDPDYPLTPGANPVQPLARYAGAASVAGDTKIVNLVVFEPDDLAAVFPAPHPFHDLRGTGYTTIVVMNNPMAPPAPGGITDTCSAVVITTVLDGVALANACSGVIVFPCDTPAGISAPAAGAPTLARYTNPGAAGTYLWVSFHQSLRDADGDGKENDLDTCPTLADAYDPRTGAGVDADGDGIADVCDLVIPSAADQDFDGWLNTGDNCPQAVNGTQVEGELAAAYNLAAPRGGPRTDGMGDACDAAPGVANGAFETTLSVYPNCIGGADGDGDGWCAGGGPGVPVDPFDGAPFAVPEDYDLVFPMSIAHSGSGAAPPMRQPLQVCNDGIDNDGDALIDIFDEGIGVNTCRPKGFPPHPGFPACPALGCAVDTDGDGFTDEAERHIGTDALGRCEVGATVAASGDWPPDLVANGASTDKVNLPDIASFVAPAPRKLNTSPGDPGFNARWDLVPGSPVGINWIVLADIAAVVAGPTGFPPMFGGVRAFNGPVCTAHPTYGD